MQIRLTVINEWIRPKAEFLIFSQGGKYVDTYHNKCFENGSIFKLYLLCEMDRRSGADA